MCAAVLFAASCSRPEASSNVVALPTHTLSGALPVAGLTGKLAYEQPCFTVTDRGETYVLIWPPGFMARRDGDFVVIVGATGLVFSPPTELSFTGGVYEGDSANLVRDNVMDLPAACDREPFWLVTEVATRELAPSQ